LWSSYRSARKSPRDRRRLEAIRSPYSARRYEASASIAPWHFLTTYSNLFLKPVLRDMGEEISIDRGTSSGGGVVINHLLKVFLIDNQGFVREIYSNQSLDPAMILGDIKTLLLEESKANGDKE
jgi:protein SCO1/2